MLSLVGIKVQNCIIYVILYTQEVKQWMSKNKKIFSIINNIFHVMKTFFSYCCNGQMYFGVHMNNTYIWGQNLYCSANNKNKIIISLRICAKKSNRRVIPFYQPTRR